ncbi:MAG: putative quinol monooxygenase [Marinoscillum sp.]
MITRIVRMTFDPDSTESFEKIFAESKEKIRTMEGCEYLSLHVDHHHPNIYYTVSKWQSQAALDTYRQSDFFKNTWARTKVLFSEKPSAYSLDQLTEIP